MAATPLFSGYWYSTSRKFPDAHLTPDGRSVGVYTAPGYAQEPVDDGAGNITFRTVATPGHVTIQAEDGHDLQYWDAKTRTLKLARFVPEELPDLRILEEMDHLPEARKLGIPPGSKVRLVPTV